MQGFVQELTFDQIKTIWQLHLWPQRQSPIEANSALEPDMTISMENMKEEACHLGWVEDHIIRGVVSGHQTRQRAFRVRGLWVEEDCRRQGVAKQLIHVLESWAAQRGCQKLWTFPRVSSERAYQRLGFQILHKVEGLEFGPHSLAVKMLANQPLAPCH